MMKKIFAVFFVVALLLVLVSPGLALAERYTSRLQERTVTPQAYNNFSSEQRQADGSLRARQRAERPRPPALPAAVPTPAPDQVEVLPTGNDQPSVIVVPHSSEPVIIDRPQPLPTPAPVVKAPVPAPTPVTKKPAPTPTPAVKAPVVEPPTAKPPLPPVPEEKIVPPVVKEPVVVEPKESPQPSTSAHTQLEQAVLKSINAYRQSKNLPTLKWNETLATVARQHSSDMATGKVPFSHNGFDARFSTLKIKAGISAMGENVAYNYGYTDPVAHAVAGWLKSAGHLKNIVGNYDLSGVGVTKNADGYYYLTQLFAR